MSRFVGALPAVALAVALFACARSASEPVGGGTPDAAIPPSGNTPTPDGGTEAPPGNPAPDAGSAGSPAVVPPGATLIDPGPIKGIYSASSDGRTVLVSRQTSGPPYWTGDLIVEHGGKATVVATEGVEWAQFFSADGSAFLFSVNGIIHLARSDGTVVPGIALGPGDHTMVGRWLYYHQVASDGQLQLFRRIAPDGQPQLLWSAPPQASGIGSYFDQPSADGEAFYICPFSAPTCHVGLQDAVAPIEIVSSNFVTISPDDKWVFSACDLYDVTGASRDLGCDASQLFPSFSQELRRYRAALRMDAV